MSRRNFLRLGALTVAGIALSTCGLEHIFDGNNLQSGSVQARAVVESSDEYGTRLDVDTRRPNSVTRHDVEANSADLEIESEKLVRIGLNEGSFIYPARGTTSTGEKYDYIWIENVTLDCGDLDSNDNRVTRSINFPLGVDIDYFKNEIQPVLDNTGLGSGTFRDNKDTVVVIDDRTNEFWGIARKEASGCNWIYQRRGNYLSPDSAFDLPLEAGNQVVCGSGR